MSVKRLDNVGIVLDDLDDTLARLGKLGAKLVDEIVNYEDMHRLRCIRGPEGLLIGLAQELGQGSERAPPPERHE